MAESVDAADLKSVGIYPVPVQVWPSAPKFLMQGYTVGVAGQTVNLLSLDSGSATLSPCTNSNS